MTLDLFGDLGLCCRRAVGGVCREHQRIADAIRAAVLEEREACAAMVHQGVVSRDLDYEDRLVMECLNGKAVEIRSRPQP